MPQIDFNAILNANWLPATIVIVFSLAGIVLTLITLPGTWLAVIVGILVAWWRPDMLSWWAVGAAALVAVLGEVVEFFASAMGATKGGSSKKGATGAIIGSIAGAILGAPLLFPIGTIVGAVVGAGVGTAIVERGASNKSWADTTRAAKGAAVGRLAATIGKTALAAVLAAILITAVLV